MVGYATLGTIRKGEIMKKDLFYFLIIAALVVLVVFTCKRTEVHHNEHLQREIDSLELIVQLQQGNIAMLNAEIETTYKVIDSLQELPEKIKTVYLHQIKLIDGFSQAQTTKGLTKLLNVECGLPYAAKTTIFERDTVLLINFNEARCFLKLEADRDQWHDLANVYEGLNVQYEEVIELQTGVIASQDTIIEATKKQAGIWEHAYNDVSSKVEKTEKQKKLWRGVAIGSVVLNLLLIFAR